MANWWEAAPLVEEPKAQGNWWDEAPLVEDAAPQAEGPWTKYQKMEEPAEVDKSYTGGILPFSVDAQGNKRFDSDAGILGAVKRAFMLPGDAYFGKVDPMSQEGIGRALEFASVFSPPTPGLRSGDMIIPGEKRAVRQSAPSVPTADQLYDEAARNFEAMRNSGVDYASDAVKNAAQAMKRALEEDGFDAEVAGRTHRILDRLASPPEDSVANIKGLHSARKTFGKIAQNFNDPPDQSAASQVIRGLDEFIGADDTSSIVAGTASDAASALKAANANYAAAKRSDLITGVERAADLRAAAANSGQNTGNSIRQRIASALINGKQISGFSPDEVAALEGISRGSAAQNTTRYIGNLLGGGGGLGQAVTAGMGAAAGGAAGGGVGAAFGATAPAAIGAGSKSLSNYLTRRALANVDEMVRMRSPLYEAMKANAPMQPSRQAIREAMVRWMLVGPQEEQAQSESSGW